MSDDTRRGLPVPQRWRSGLTFVSEVGGAIGFVVLVVTAIVSTGFRHAVAAAAAYLYPGWLIGVLIALIVVLIWLLRRSKKPRLAMSDSARESDQRVLHALIAALPRESVRWLDNHDFGTPWGDDYMRAYDYTSHEFNEVEHRLRDPDLESLRQALLAAINDLLEVQARRAGVDARGRMSVAAWDNTPSTSSDSARERTKDESRRLINEAAQTTKAAYDALIAAALDKGFSLEAAS